MNAKRRKELEKLVERIQGIIADLEVLEMRSRSYSYVI
jgi:hypothetical protein